MVGSHKVSCLRVLIGLVVMVGSVANAAGPSFKGTWELDTTKSDFGSGPKPECSIVRSVSQQGLEISVSDQVTYPRKVENVSGAVHPRVQDARTAVETVKFRTDGQITTDTTTGAVLSVAATWKGSSLLLTIKGTRSDGQQYTQQESWSLSEDGESLQIKQRTNSQDFTNTAKYVFRKLR